MNRRTEARREMEERGWIIRYVPHEIIRDHMACYRVTFDGQEIYPPAAEKLGIPNGEVWLSTRLKRYEDFVLFHELAEIKHRAAGYSVKEAHRKAEKDELQRFGDDPLWLEMNSQLTEGREHLPSCRRPLR
ncbi:MAG: hypothetical protein R6U88_03835 [Candidatus Bipolaricaulota bacterium]